MRVTLDLNGASTSRVSGTFTSDHQHTPTPFDGWLDLMRLLESAATEVSSSPATSTERGLPSTGEPPCPSRH